MAIYIVCAYACMLCHDPHLALVEWEGLKRLSIEVKLCHDGLAHFSDERT